MNTIINFTKKTLDALPIPKTGVVIYHDKNKKALKLRVRSSGTKTFFLSRRVNGKPDRITIGHFPDISVEQARKQADLLNARIAHGVNPNDEKGAVKNELTLQELFDHYLEKHSKPHKRTWDEDVRQFNRYLKDWASKRLSEIDTARIQELHIKVGKHHGIYAANRLLALLSSMFNKAIHVWQWKHPNPAHGIPKFKEESRERFLQGDELPRFFHALAEEPNETARDYILVSLLTGARKGNVLAMRWEQISFERATWTIPKTKIGVSQTIPLVPEAIEILKRRMIDPHKTEWVFPGTGKAGYFAEPKAAWRRILKQANIENLRIHDLRRSLGSWQAATGANLSVIGKTLGHRNTSTTAIYARLNLDPVRESMSKATSAMFECFKEKESDEKNNSV